MQKEYVNKKEIKEKGENYISPKEFTEQLKRFYDMSDAAEKFAENDESKEAMKARREEKRALDICGVSIYKMVLRFSGQW